jgi:Fe-S cluster assembly iron-binding protein IscA
MALDEPGDGDARFEVDGFTYVIAERMLAKVQPVTLDFKATGFHVSAQLSNMGRNGRC